MSLRIFVACDECGANAPSVRTLDMKTHVYRAALRDTGWRVAQKGGKDTCPDCISKFWTSKLLDNPDAV